MNRYLLTILILGACALAYAGGPALPPSTATVTGLGTMATVNSPVPVANGGTAATSAAAARTSLGVVATQTLLDHEADQSTHGCTVVASTTLVTDHTGDSSDPHGTTLTQTNASFTLATFIGSALAYYGLTVANFATDNVAGKITGINFYGKDTVGTTKEAGRIVFIDEGANLVANTLVIYNRSGDTVVPALTVWSSGVLALRAAPEHADNAAAIAAGLATGAVYRTGDALKVVHD